MKKLFYLFVLAVSLTACVDDTDYDTPQIYGENPVIPTEQLSSIQNVVAQWNAANPTGTTSTMVEFVADDEAPVFISGYVVSNDQTGNFYKELFIQDSPSDPQYAVKIMVDVASLYTKYDLGRKVYLQLNGLAINKSHGELVIGEIIGGALENIRENKAKQCLLRNATADVLTPKTITTNQISNAYLGMYVKFENLQFDLDVVGKPYVNPLDSYDSYRTMVSCETGGEVVLETSTFATFREQIVQSGKGSVEGILSRDYDNGFFVLRVNNTNVFSFTGERCDPLFQDGFTNGFAKWTTYSVTGAQTWVIDTQYGNPGSCAKMSGYAGGNNVNEDWLITKPINLTGITAAKLTFQSARNYSGNNLVVYMSTDYNGTGAPSTATWTTLPATLSTTGFAWTNSGDIDISAAAGSSTVYIAFKYTCTASASATYEIDNVKITEL